VLFGQEGGFQGYFGLWAQSGLPGAAAARVGGMGWFRGEDSHLSGEVDSRSFALLAATHLCGCASGEAAGGGALEHDTC